MLLLLIGVGALDISFTMLAQTQFIAFGCLFLVALAVILWFFYVESRHPDPVLPIKVLKTPVVEYIIGYLLILYVSKASEYL